MTDHSRSLTRAFVTSAVGHSLVRERFDPFIISREAVVALPEESSGFRAELHMSRIFSFVKR